MKSRTLFVLIFFIFFVAYSGNSEVKNKIKLTALNSMQRIGQSDKPCGACAVEIKAAKNEVESFQVAISALDKNINVINVDVSELIGKNGSYINRDNIKLFREDYVMVRVSSPRAELPPGLYPDPLVPFINPITGKPVEPLKRHRKRWGDPVIITGSAIYPVPFQIYKGQNRPIWVDVYVPKNTPAGTYRGKFTVTTEGNTQTQIPITLTVWDFTLPDGPTHRNHFGHFGNIAWSFDVEYGSKKYEQIEMHYCEAMAEHRINPPIPHNLLPEVNEDGSLTIIPEKHRELKKFMDRLNVTDFQIPRATFSRLPRSTSRSDYKYISPENRAKTIRYYREYYKYLKENGWEKRAYLYMLDEPNLKENYEQVRVLGELVHEAVPELKCLVVEQAYPQDPSWPNIDPAVDIWCPLWAFIERKTINEKIAQGDEVWSYTAGVQRSPRSHPGYEYTKKHNPPYWHIDFPLIVYRVPTWINRQYNITGLLYWTTVNSVRYPWANPESGNRLNGTGFLFYPGNLCGIDGPVSCIRMKNIRDSMEDYEYFVILEKLAGKESVKEVVDTIAPSWWDFSKNPDDFLEAREKLAEGILKALR